MAEHWTTAAGLSKSRKLVLDIALKMVDSATSHLGSEEITEIVKEIIFRRVELPKRSADFRAEYMRAQK
jgi:hypothetical protein